MVIDDAEVSRFLVVAEEMVMVMVPVMVPVLACEIRESCCL